MSDINLRIALFGTLSLQKGPHLITHFQTRKTGALLAHLAYYRDKLHRREELMEQLWPGDDLESSRNRLRIALTWLRKETGVSALTQEPILVADRSTVHLNPHFCSTDTFEFEQHLQCASGAPSEAEQLRHLKAAAELYRGELLPDFEEPWIRSERHRLADAYLMSLRRLVKLLAHAHQFDEAIDYARHAVKTDPYREESHRLLMRLYAAVGRPAAALRQYYELDDLLKEDFRSAPTSTTRELAEQITTRQQSRAVGSGMGHANGAQEHSGHRSGGQGSDSGDIGSGKTALLAELPPPLPPMPLPLPRERRPILGLLPNHQAPLCGREENIVAVREMLDTPETRLVTLTGVGGCGKTRLALAVAQRVHQEFGGIICFVSLTDLSDAQQIPSALAKALGLEPKGRTPLLNQVAASLRNQPALLVLDNFEHLAETGASLIRSLLDQAPNLSCLVTSRHRLNLTCEYEYGVRPLPVPLLSGTPERLLEFGSVQMFVDRARNAFPDFQFSADNAGTIAAICDRLDGIPLSIELAAAWAAVQTPEEILEQLNSRFALLVNQHRDAPGRHSSLRATLDWSFNLLEPEAQRFFMHLAAFRGGWTLESAQAVCETSHALETLMQLRDRSLLQCEATGPKMRFSLLETVREYAEQRLSDAEHGQMCHRHAAYFLELAEQADAGMRGGESVLWLKRVNLEHDNFRAALQFSLEREDATAALKISAALWRFWYTRGHLAEGFHWLERSLAACPDAEVGLRVRALMGAGNIAYERCEYEIARPLYEEALKLRRALHDVRGIASALNSLGNIAYDLNDYRTARTLFEESLVLYRQTDAANGKACVLSNLANISGHAGDYGTARTLHAEALTLFRETADLPNIALTLNNLADKVLQCADWESALPLLDEALRIGRILESNESLAYSLTGFATLALRQGEKERAARLFGTVHTLREDSEGVQHHISKQEFEQNCQLLRSALGETTFQKIWDKGRVMRIEQVAAFLAEAQ